MGCTIRVEANTSLAYLSQGECQRGTQIAASLTSGKQLAPDGKSANENDASELNSRFPTGLRRYTSVT